MLIYDAASPEKARHVLADPVITELAARYGKSPAQIILRWHVQRDVAVIPKSVHPERMRENIAIFDFSLAEEDMAAIQRLDAGIRGALDRSLSKEIPILWKSPPRCGVRNAEPRGTGWTEWNPDRDAAARSMRGSLT